LYFLGWILVTRPWRLDRRTFCSDLSRWWTQPPGWYSHRRDSTTSARCSADSIGWRLNPSPTRSQLWCTNINTVHMAPTYLYDEDLRRPADTQSIRLLRSASSTSLDVRHTRLSTVGDRAFPVAAARRWNSLQSLVTAPPLSFFCSRLKSHLFSLSYRAFWLICTVPAQWLVILDTIIVLNLTFISWFRKQNNNVMFDWQFCSVNTTYNVKCNTANSVEYHRRRWVVIRYCPTRKHFMCLGLGVAYV